MSKLINLLASIKLALVVLLVIAVACIAGTLLPQGADVAKYLEANPGSQAQMDLLGFLENESVAPCRNIETPFGTVSVLPPETALVERVLLAFYPQPDADARDVACKLLAACISGETPVDWEEVNRLAALPDFLVTSELEELREEVQRELAEQA